MFKPLIKFCFSFSLILSSPFTSASLITNGSFETLTFADNSTSRGIVYGTHLKDFQNKTSGWDVFYTLPGWVTTAGNGIELQKNIVTKSADGTNHVELDSHPWGSSNAVMTQSLDSLTVGSKYLLEFEYKPRTNQVNDNGINVFWYNAAIDFNFNLNANFAIDGKKKTSPFWMTQSIVLTAQSESMKLSFGAFGQQNSLGGLIDNISLVQINSTTASDIPEPSVFALSLFGFILLGRRQYKKSIIS